MRRTNMSPQDLPHWITQLTFCQAQARWGAGLIPDRIWILYRKLWERTHGRSPKITRTRGGINHSARDLHTTASLHK